MNSNRSGAARKAAATRKARAKKTKVRKTTKGALIKGMSRKLPSEILASPVFREKLTELLKGYAGIYALYSKNRLYYVGLTTNLFGRVRHHLRGRHKGKWDHFVIARIKKVNYLKDIETLLMHLMDLPGNKVKGHVPKDGDINRILRQILSVHTKEIREIRKVLRT